LDRRIFPPDLNAPDALSYLDHLISLPLTTLTKEPTLISAEAATVESELTNLCYREYSTFLSVHRCSAAVRSAFDDFQGSLDNLLDSVPVLEDECRLFAKRTQGLSAGRNRSILVQENQDKLLDLLELPQLMETCVRNGYYQEAMELANHAKDLLSRYSGNRLVIDTVKEVDGVNQLMLAQLFSLLREPVKLSTAMKTVSYLRRMDVMDEASLGLAFLSGRLYNFRTQLLQIEKDRADPVRYLRRYIDSFREHVYDILSQHSAMFDDFDGLVSFAGQCVTDLVQLVQSYIPRIAHDPASLSSVLIQLGYCSLSFARIGLDFAPLIAAPFADTVLSTYSHAVAAASDKLAGTLKAASNGQGIPTDALVDAEQRANVLASPPRFLSGADSPPHGLAAFPPLATFINDNITALNALRLLAPTTLAAHLVRVLAQTLLADSGAILAFLRDATQNVSAVNGDRPAHKRTPSSPRAQLLRRNTETQLSPAARAAKRHESRQISLIIAEVWLGGVEFLFGALTQEVLGRSDVELDPDLAARLEEVRAWISANRVDEDEAVRADARVAVDAAAQASASSDQFTAEPGAVQSSEAAGPVEAVTSALALPIEVAGVSAETETAATDTAIAENATETAATEDVASYVLTEGAAVSDRLPSNDTSQEVRADALGDTESNVVEPLFGPASVMDNSVIIDERVPDHAPIIPPNDLSRDGDGLLLGGGEATGMAIGPVANEAGAAVGDLAPPDDKNADVKRDEAQSEADARGQSRVVDDRSSETRGQASPLTGGAESLRQEDAINEAKRTITSGQSATDNSPDLPQADIAAHDGAGGTGKAMDDWPAQTPDGRAAAVDSSASTPIEAPSRTTENGAVADGSMPEINLSPPQTPADGSEAEGNKEPAQASKSGAGSGNKKKKKKKKKS
jgi:hypothetical protein